MIAIIPARGGSKGLPRKNIKQFNGKPLIQCSIEVALQCTSIDRVIVSTDDEEIASISVACGAEVPFLRPKELAQDQSKALDTYLYTMERLFDEETLEKASFIVLQPTSPLRSSRNVEEAIALFNEFKADSVISITEAKYPPNWLKKISQNGKLENLIVGDNNLNRQDYDKLYIPNGAIFIFNYRSLKISRNYYMENTYPYIMSKRNSIDIDDYLDFKMAEFLESHNCLETYE